MKVFRKHTSLSASPSGADAARLVAEEYWGADAEVLTPDFLFQAGAVLAYRIPLRTFSLVFFLSDAQSFLDRLGRILEACVSSRSYVDALRGKPGDHRDPAHQTLDVFIFTPEISEKWKSVAGLLSIPFEVVTYSPIISGDEEAILLEGRAGDPAGYVSQHTPEHRFLEPAIPAHPEKHPVEKPVIAAKIKKENELPPSGADAQTILPPRRTSESFFQRAKLTRDDIRVIMSLEHHVEEILKSH